MHVARPVSYSASWFIFIQEEIVRPMAIAVCDKQRVFETERKATHEAIAADATKSEGDRKVVKSDRR